jgi:hypothetical protein
MATAWFLLDIASIPEIKAQDFKNTLRAMAKHEWGEGTEVTFANDLIKIQNGDSVREFKRGDE